MITDKVKRLHGKNKGNLPFPCGYCYYWNRSIECDTFGRANIVVRFKPDMTDLDADGHPMKVFCDGHLEGPTGMGVCKKFAFNEKDVRPHCIDDVFAFVEKDYTMYVISKMYEHPDGITMNKLIERQTKGYNTRKLRIFELIDSGFIDKVDKGSQHILYLTGTGKRLAKAVRSAYLDILAVIEEGDVLAQDDFRKVFTAIREADGQFTIESLRQLAENNPRVEDIVHILEDEEYIECMFDDSDADVLRYLATPSGVRAFNRYGGGKNEVKE